MVAPHSGVSGEQFQACADVCFANVARRQGAKHVAAAEQADAVVLDMGATGINLLEQQVQRFVGIAAIQLLTLAVTAGEHVMEPFVGMPQHQRHARAQ